MWYWLIRHDPCRNQDLIIIITSALYRYIHIYTISYVYSFSWMLLLVCLYFSIIYYSLTCDFIWLTAVFYSYFGLLILKSLLRLFICVWVTLFLLVVSVSEAATVFPVAILRNYELYAYQFSIVHNYSLHSLIYINNNSCNSYNITHIRWVIWKLAMFISYIMWWVL